MTKSTVENINRFVIFRQNGLKASDGVGTIEWTISRLTTDEVTNSLAREFLINPDKIKALLVQTAFYVTKDENNVYRFIND